MFAVASSAPLGKCPQAQSALETNLVEADESWRFNY